MEEPRMKGEGDYVGEGQQVTMEQLVIALFQVMQNLTVAIAENTKAMQYLAVTMTEEEESD